MNELLRIKVVKCHDCGRVGLAVNDQRITPHKCSGRWTTLVASSYSVPRIAELTRERDELLDVIKTSTEALAKVAVKYGVVFTGDPFEG